MPPAQDEPVAIGAVVVDVEPEVVVDTMLVMGIEELGVGVFTLELDATVELGTMLELGTTLELGIALELGMKLELGITLEL